MKRVILSMVIVFLYQTVCCMPVLAKDCDWPAIETCHHPGTYWHWMASAVDEENLTRELETFAAAGMGGVHIIPIYGAKGYEARYVEYLSPRWMTLLGHTLREAKRLGMWVDMTTGTGWNFGGPTISDDMSNAVVKYHIEKNIRQNTFTLASEGKTFQSVMALGENGKVQDITAALTQEGNLNWTPPAGVWTVIAVWQEPSGIVVERAAPGGEGWMLNLFQGDVMQHYLARFDAAFNASDTAMPRAMYHDSYEYKCNWASDLFMEFEKRRGYRMQDHLDVFWGDSDSEEQARLKCDYRTTLDEMILDNGIGAWAEWAGKRGCLTRNQAHGSPGNLLDLYAAADIPETEMFNKDREPLVSKFASSAAHVMGKKLVAAETGTWLREHFHVTLADLKLLIDDMFVSGVNHVLYHGTCYSPADAPWPGWLFYASTQMNPRNAIWHDVDILNTYIARCQSLLQDSHPDNDILLYWPISDLWHNPKGMEMGLSIHRRAWFEEQSIGGVARRLWEGGYAFDYVSDRQLSPLSASSEGIVAPGGTYRALLVPRCTRIPVNTMKKICSLAENGGIILFEGDIPKDVPGLGDIEGRREALRTLTGFISGKGKHQVGKGYVFIGDDLEMSLEQVGVAREKLNETPGLRHIRFQNDEGHLYFLSNRGDKIIDGYLPVARPMQDAVLMDPMTGRTGIAALGGQPDKNAVYIQLAPGESIFLRTFLNREATGLPWSYFHNGGDSTSIEGNWKVAFIKGGPEVPPSFETTTLASWTESCTSPHADSFAGTARYSIAFDLPANVSGDAWRLNLGNVAESARIKINGADIGAVIMPPYGVICSADLMKIEENLLEIEVTNLSANRIRDLDQRDIQWRIFNDINFVNIDYKPFDASGWPILPSGLLGPVTLTPLHKITTS